MIYAFAHCVGDREFVVFVRAVEPLGGEVVVAKHIAGYRDVEFNAGAFHHIPGLEQVKPDVHRTLPVILVSPEQGLEPLVTGIEIDNRVLFVLPLRLE